MAFLQFSPDALQKIQTLLPAVGQIPNLNGPVHRMLTLAFHFAVERGADRIEVADIDAAVAEIDEFHRTPVARTSWSVSS